MQTTVYNGFGQLGAFAHGDEHAYGALGTIRRADVDRAQQKCDAAEAQLAGVRAAREKRVAARPKVRLLGIIPIKDRKVDNARVRRLERKAARLCTKASELAASPSGQRQVELREQAERDFADFMLDSSTPSSFADEVADTPEGSAVLPILIAGGAAVVLIGGAVAFTTLRRRRK